jgi:hypothetical protein
MSDSVPERRFYVDATIASYEKVLACTVGPDRAVFVANTLACDAALRRRELMARLDGPTLPGGTVRRARPKCGSAVCCSTRT